MKLIIPHRIAAEIMPRLQEVAPDCAVVHIDDEATPDGDLADAEVFLRWWTPAPAFKRLLATAPRLRWMHTPSAGVDNLLTADLLERDIQLTCSAGVHAIPIAEFVLMFMLGHVKRVRELAALEPEDGWIGGKRLRLGELYGKTLLILGMGQIGQEIARRAAAFGMHVYGSRRHPAPMDGVERVVGEGAWRELLPQADYIAIAAPLTEATRGMVDAAAFARMKPEAYLINIARGQIVDTEALLVALHEGRIAGAGLDALPEEPLPRDHPLWSAPNVWITPHISWSSPHMQARALDVFLENLRRYRAGEPLINLVDKQAGY
jgi:phosphoglycerate dehydrogenase-like enzyme